MFSLDQYRALHDGAGLFPRDDRGRICCSAAPTAVLPAGPAVERHRRAEPGAWCYATLLTAQGRMISDMRVFELGGHDPARPRGAPVTDAVRAHLDKFVITEDVAVEDVTATFAQIGLYGPQAAAILDAAVAAEASATPCLRPRATTSAIAGFDLIVTAGGCRHAHDRRSSVPVPFRSTAETAEVTRVEAGIPRFLVDMDATTIPLEAGIEDRAISLTKGCYVGQEVIIRVLHRGGGRVAKKLVGLVGRGRRDGQRDDRVFSGEREIGRDHQRGRLAGARQADRARLRAPRFHRAGDAVNVRTAAGDTAAIVVALPFAL